MMPVFPLGSPDIWPVERKLSNMRKPEIVQSGLDERTSFVFENGKIRTIRAYRTLMKGIEHKQ